MKKTPVSNNLEKEASEMEGRLKLLRSKMTEFKEEDDALPRKGGARWKSARDDRGSVTSYAKDIKDASKTRIPKLSTDIRDIRDTSKRASISEGIPKKSLEDFRTMEVSKWKLKEVIGWLDYISLPQYKDVFSKNEIDGPVLLELSLDDLDYMSVTVLGHRKTLLKSIEELRRAKRIVVRTSSAGSAREAAKIVKESVTLIPKDDVIAEPVAKVHWSELEPLVDREGPKSPRQISVNLLEDDDVIDEEAERAAFQAAVMDWRRGNNNPARAGDAEVRKVDEKKSERKDKVMEVSKRIDVRKKELDETGGESDPNLWRNPFPAKEDKTGDKGKGLAQGTLDEAKEHEEFVKAVNSWREGRTGTLPQGSRSKVQDLVSNLEQQYSKQALELQEQHTKSIRELSELRRAAVTKPLDVVSSEFESEEPDESAHGSTGGSPVGSRLSYTSPHEDDTVGSKNRAPTSTSFSKMDLREIRDGVYSIGSNGLDYSDDYTVDLA